MRQVRIRRIRSGYLKVEINLESFNVKASREINKTLEFDELPWLQIDIICCICRLKDYLIRNIFTIVKKINSN